jgi:hypothetical protein
VRVNFYAERYFRSALLRFKSLKAETAYDVDDDGAQCEADDQTDRHDIPAVHIPPSLPTTTA